MGTSVTLAFKSILKDPKYSTPVQRRPIFVRTDKGKLFLNLYFQYMLQHEGIQFQGCRNPDVKCSIVEKINVPFAIGYRGILPIQMRIDL